MMRTFAGWISTAVVMLSVFLIAGPVMAGTRTLEGTVAYRERIALPPSAVLDVQLVDVSRADAAAVTLASTRIEPVGQVPIPFTLWFNDADVEPSHTYAVRARILVDDRLWFTTTEQHRVLDAGDSGAPLEILVSRVDADERPEGIRQLSGAWIVEDIAGGGAAKEQRARLELADDGAVIGTGGCNRMVGKAAVAGDTIRFGAIASTQMACLPAIMEQEAQFFAALEKVRGWRIDEAGSRLQLLDDKAKPLLTLGRDGS